MSSRQPPSKGDRHRHNSKTRLVGAAGANVRAVAPPELEPGQVRCPACRNATTLTPRGVLRRHRDLFGETCWNKATGDPTGVTAPPVRIPEARKPPGRTATSNAAEPRLTAEEGRSRLDAGSMCRECDKWLPGERSLCGRCYARQGR